jgi:hypothetical protein
LNDAPILKETPLLYFEAASLSYFAKGAENSEKTPNPSEKKYLAPR